MNSIDEVLNCCCSFDSSMRIIARHVKTCLCGLKNIILFLREKNNFISFDEKIDIMTLYSKIFTSLYLHQAILETINERQNFPEYEKVQMMIKKMIGDFNLRMLNLA